MTLFSSVAGTPREDDVHWYAGVANLLVWHEYGDLEGIVVQSTEQWRSLLDFCDNLGVPEAALNALIALDPATIDRAQVQQTITSP